MNFTTILFGGFIMGKTKVSQIKFHQYFEEWIDLYKVGSVRDVTLKKYHKSLEHVIKLEPELKLKDLNRRSYQTLLNSYAETHEKQTTMDFHHQLKGAILDAVDDGLIQSNPTRKIVIKGKDPSKKKTKFLNQHEVQSLLKELDLTNELNWDWFLLLIAKTGLRFAEALALTPSDFDFSTQKLTINKTWNYKHSKGGFSPTKNFSSNRKIQMDWQLAMQFSKMISNLEHDKPIFVKGRVYNSTINKRLEKLCKQAEVPIISVHALRHTHASLLIFANVSIASIAKRLGHSSMTTTQETYLHIINELENQDTEKIIRHLSMLT